MEKLKPCKSYISTDRVIFKNNTCSNMKLEAYNLQNLHLETYWFYVKCLYHSYAQSCGSLDGCSDKTSCCTFCIQTAGFQDALSCVRPGFFYF